VEGKSSWTTFLNDFFCSSEQLHFWDALDKIQATLFEYYVSDSLR
jgi:hypothetical protein